MKSTLLALALILTPLLCPFWASAQAIDGEWKKDLTILSDANKLRSLNALLDAPKDLKNPKDLAQLSRRLRDKAATLEKQSSGGVDSGGGGNLILYKNGELKLLDFVVNPIPMQPTSRPPLVIPTTASLKAWGIDRLQVNDFVPTDIFEAKVLAWERSSPFMAGLLRQALSNIPVYVLDYELSVRDQRYFMPASVRTTSVQGVVTAALYLKDYGVLISKKYFERLDFENQVGLLLHESLRHIQFTYGYANSDKSLQKLTAALMNGPQEGESLDSAEYLDGPLLLSFLRQAELETLALSAIPQGCLAYETALKNPCPIRRLKTDHVTQAYSEISAFLQDRRNDASDKLKYWVYDQTEPLISLAYALSGQDLKQVVLGAKDAAVGIEKSISGNALDEISRDFNKHGYFWSSYKSEARRIIKELRAGGIIQ